MKMKAIAWRSLIFVVGSNTLLDIKPDKILINNFVEIVYLENPLIKDRAEKEPVFKENLDFIARKAIASFLMAEDVELFDLAQTMLKATFEPNESQKEKTNG